MDNKYDLRKKDVITGIFLFVFGVAMFATAATYPMRESYGGVKNVWYASPALFPMIVAALLIIFALILAANGVWYQLTHQKQQTSASPDRWQRMYALLFIIATLSAFVYFYIPTVDFWIASIIYLYLFITHFYIHDTFSFTTSGSVFVGMGMLMRVMGAITELESMSAQFLRDGLITAYFICFVIYTFRRVRSLSGSTRPTKIVLAVVLATVTIIVIGFKFGVLIPMPREGFYCYYLDEIYFFFKSSF